MKMLYVYIFTNKPKDTLYIGVTSNLQKRISNHKKKDIDGFTKKYNLSKLVYVESFDCDLNALSTEKRLKHWHRQWKINLIEKSNPTWNDLYKECFEVDPETSSG